MAMNLGSDRRLSNFGSTFRKNNNFAEGGGCVETLLLPPVTPAHGAWERIGKREFEFAVVHHILDQSGNHIGTVRAKATARFKGKDKFEAEFAGGFYDTAGKFLFPVGGTERGTRISTETF